MSGAICCLAQKRACSSRENWRRPFPPAERQLFCGFSTEELAALGALQEKLMHNLAVFEEKRQKEESRP